MAKFSIEVTKARVDVRTSDIQPRFNTATIWAVLFLWGLGIYVLAKVIPTLVNLLRMPRNSDIWTWLLTSAMLCYGIILLWRGFREVFPSGESLVCDGATLTVGHIPDHVLNGRWIYQSLPIQAVKRLSFGAVRISRYGGIPGLIFAADNKKRRYWRVSKLLRPIRS
jgi:hypothetical protein